MTSNGSQTGTTPAQASSATNEAQSLASTVVGVAQDAARTVADQQKTAVVEQVEEVAQALSREGDR